MAGGQHAPAPRHEAKVNKVDNWMGEPKTRSWAASRHLLCQEAFSPCPIGQIPDTIRTCQRAALGAGRGVANRETRSWYRYHAGEGRPRKDNDPSGKEGTSD